MSTTNQDLSRLTVLAAFAHPDDEGFGSGGTLAMLASRGAKVTLVCSTNGDVGEISDPDLATPENLYQVRQEELRQAMQVTGVKDVRFLNYRDSGMAGTEDNNHPNSLHQAAPDQVVGQLVAIIHEIRPNIVITHDPYGGYGHPDHQAVCRHATSAFSVAADAAAFPGQFWSPGLLYYVCFPRSNFRRMWQEMLDHGITPPFASMDVDLIGTPDAEVTTTVDVSRYVDTKVASLNCHRTQMSPNGPFAQLPEEKVREYMRTEYFMLARPQGTPKDQDLLGGL
ncbi:MAG: PIG-L family deacetylase [Chloroflexi bacterium]|nr:PIG-L family deacetylase [Chloroflexota bacterium]